MAKRDRRKHRIIFTSVASLILVVVTAYFVLSAIVAEKLSCPSRRAVTSNPSNYSFTYEHVQFQSAIDHIPLDGWYIDSPGKRVILVLHGKDEARDDYCVGLMDVICALVQNGYDVFAFDFRGHGASGGKRTSLGLLEVRDVAGALEYLKSRGINEVGAIGFSMGAVTALNSAPNQPQMRAIVADSAFADVNLLLATELPKSSGLQALFNPGILFMGRLMYGIDLKANKPQNAVACLGSRPIFLIHGALDSLVPISHAYALQKAGENNPNLQLWIVPDTGHVQAFKQHPEEYMRQVVRFFNQYLP